MLAKKAAISGKPIAHIQLSLIPIGRDLQYPLVYQQKEEVALEQGEKSEKGRLVLSDD